MKTISGLLVFFVAIIHLWFLVLEMFLWRKPLGLKTFRMSHEKAKITAPLAANQGLYNGFLAAGLLASFFFSEPSVIHAFQLFFLSCVVVAGVYGAWSVNKTIFFIQAAPALLTLILILFL